MKFKKPEMYLKSYLKLVAEQANEAKFLITTGMLGWSVGTCQIIHTIPQPTVLLSLVRLSLAVSFAYCLFGRGEPGV